MREERIEQVSKLEHDGVYRGIINAWCFYDWANSVFVTTVAAALFPPFFRSVAMRAGLAGNEATAWWGYTVAAGLLIVALAAPVLGAIADHTGGKKRYVAAFAGLGIAATAAFVSIGADTWRWAALLFILGNIGFAGANVFYESLLPHIARDGDMDRVSTRGYALGYVGGGLLLVLNLLWVLRPAWFGLTDQVIAIKASFLSVALWWALFSIPFFRRVPEPPGVVSRLSGLSPVRAGFARLRETLAEVRRYRQLTLFLLAFWIYNDGIGTIIKMATAYGSELGIGVTDMTFALVITQFVGIPCALLFGGLAARIGTKRSILVALGGYALICCAGYFMRTAWHFYLLALLVGTVQGGSQALSRSLFGVLVPKRKSAEFFGFFSTGEKFSGIFGPLLFGLISHWMGESRLGILALILFFTVGGGLLALVDVPRGMAEGRGAEPPPRQPVTAP